MSQYKYRDYRPGPHSMGVIMDELWDKTRARNAAIEKGWRDRRQEEQRLRDCAYASGGYPTGGNHGKRKGSGVLFWLAALAFVGAKLLHLF